MADQVATFVRRQAGELSVHREAIAGIRNRLPATHTESSLQAFFAAELVTAFRTLGAHSSPTMQRNQGLMCDEQIVAAVFDTSTNCRFVLWPSVVSSTPAKSNALEGTLSVGFRLMTPAAIEAPNYEFGRDTLLPLHELLPGKFNGYGRFTNADEFGLNILAWIAAMRIVLPDALHILQAAPAALASSRLH